MYFHIFQNTIQFLNIGEIFFIPLEHLNTILNQKRCFHNNFLPLNKKKKNKRQHTKYSSFGWKKLFQDSVLSKGLYSGIGKFLQLIRFFNLKKPRDKLTFMDLSSDLYFDWNELSQWRFINRWNQKFIMIFIQTIKKWGKKSQRRKIEAVKNS